MDEGAEIVTELLALTNLSWQLQPYSIYKAQAVLKLPLTLLHNKLDNASSHLNFDMLAGERIPRPIPILRANVQPRRPATAAPAATRPTSKRSERL